MSDEDDFSLTEEEELELDYNGTELAHAFRLKDGKLKYVVVGTGRCGTVYLAKLLSSLGFPCSHEGIFHHDGLQPALERMKGQRPIKISHIARTASNHDESMGRNWFREYTEEIVAESSYMAAPFLDHPCMDGTTVIHVVREPIPVINSFVQGFGYFTDEAIYKKYLRDYHHFIYDHAPDVGEDMDTISRAALYWVEWNQMIEERSKGRRYYRHRIEDPVNGLLKFLGVETGNYYNNTEVNHHDYSYRIHKTSDIAIEPIRERVEVLHKRYYLKLQ